ncbi:MAG: pilus assembly protein TadG-related protein [Acidimicrobiia bacterium]
MRRRAAGEAGSVTLWVLGLCLVLCVLGSLVFDLYRAFSERQEVAGWADAAAVAGATAIDEAYFRATGEARLMPGAAEARALEYLDRQDGYDPVEVVTMVAASETEVTVSLEREVEFALLGGLLAGEDPVLVQISGTATPRIGP